MSLNKVAARIMLAAAIIVILAAFVPRAVYAGCGQPGIPPCSGGEAVDQQRRATNTPYPSATAIAIQPLLPLPSGALTSGPSPDLHGLLQTAGAQTQMALTPSPTVIPSTTPTEATAAPVPTDRPVATAVALPTSVLPSTALLMIVIVAIIALLIIGMRVLLGVLGKRRGGRKYPNQD